MFLGNYDFLAPAPTFTRSSASRCRPSALSARNGTLVTSPDGRLLASVERTDFGRAVRIRRLSGP
jgi:hypothetical protein